jgi:PKD repeat protein
MVIRCKYRAGRWACEPPTVPAPPQAGRLRRPLLHALMLTTMLVVAASLAALPARAYLGDPLNLVSAVDPVSYPDAACDSSLGEYLVVWQEDFASSGDLDVWVQICASDGTPVTSPFYLAYTTSDEGLPAVASLGSGGWLVTYLEVTGSPEWIVHGVLVDPEGGCSYYTYATSSTGIVTLDVGASPSAGTYLVVYDEYNGSNWDLMYVLAGADGAPLSSGYLEGSAYQDWQPAVNQSGNNFLVSWTWYNTSTTLNNVLAMAVDASDGSVTYAFPVKSEDGLYLGDSAVASDEGDPETFLVTWTDQFSSTDYDIWYGFASGAGLLAPVHYIPSAYSTDVEADSSPAFTGLPDTFFVAWDRTAPSPYQPNLRGAYLLTDGTAGPAEVIANDGVIGEAYPRATPLYTSAGEVAVVWAQWAVPGVTWDVEINERDWAAVPPNLHDDGAEWQSVEPLDVVPGTVMTAQCDIRNDGAQSRGFYVFLYASADTTLDGSDVMFGWVWIDNVPAGAVVDCDWSGAIGGLPAGSYYLIWSIDSTLMVDESNEGDNTTVYASPFTVGEGINLHDDGPWWQGFSGTPVAAGDAWSAWCDVRNSGNLPSPAYTVRICASTDTTIDSSDYLIGEVSMPAQAAFVYADCNWTGTFPATVPGGLYYVGYIIDPTNAVAEGNEDDNASYCQWGQLYVNGPPAADFSGAPTTGEPGVVVTFTDASSDPTATRGWDFGDPGSGASNTSAEMNPTHTYANVGNYDVSLTLTNAFGNDTETKVDYIKVAAVAGAEFSGTPTSGTAPLTVAFTDASTGTIDSWSWDFGDGTPAGSAQSPSHQYVTAGSYDVSLTVTNVLGSDTETKPDYITVAPSVAADFTGDPRIGIPPLTVSFTDTSTGTPTAWAWDFGDGDTSTQADPEHEYADPGTYTVALTASNANGPDTETKSQYVLVTFPDVPFEPTEYWAMRAILACVDAGIVQGYPSGNYQPTTVVNRGQMAIYIARALAGDDAAVPEPAAGTQTFDDVAPDHWAYRYVEYCYAGDIVQGYGDLYKPDENVNRGQMAVYIARSIATPTGDAGIPDPSDTPVFPDVTSANDWAWCYKYVQYIATLDPPVVQGYTVDGVTTYRPQLEVTRDQMAVYVQRAFQLPLAP